MKFIYKINTVLLITVLLALMTIIVACTQETSNEQSSSDNTMDDASKPFAGQEIDVLLQRSGDTEYLMDNTDEFTEETGIEVNYTPIAYEEIQERTLLSLSSNSGEFDVVNPFTEMIPALQHSGWIEDLNKIPEEYNVEPIDLDQFMQNYQDYYTFNGETQFVLFQPDTRVLYYNKTLLEEAGIDPPTTWEELEEAAEALTDPDEGVYGYATSTAQGPWTVLTWLPVLYSMGENVLGPDNLPMLDSEAALEATEFYTNMVHNYSPPQGVSMDVFEIEPLLRDGTIAMATIASIVNDPNIGMMSYPLYDESTDRTGSGTTGGWGFGIVKDSDVKGAAYEWLRWATSKETMKEAALAGRLSPGRMDIYEEPDFQEANPNWEAQMEALSTSKMYFPLPVEPEAQEILGTELSRIVTEETTPEEGLDTAQEEILELIKGGGYYSE
ncbi:ABC transporter substrate-binding protein [Alteribacillus sp. YIM 98480]|uniref:ABC transporter substrate-binding protein n=1 Tax=Alteribacillus sp. YIM 98480 TaxID=2606599 RepID=UPI00131E9A41|nr:extracellular solute-binding protein [Alteribacillus sp. YIM 98480]